ERTERAAIERHAEPTLVCRQRKRELFLVARRERGRLLAQALQAQRAIGRCIGRREAADFHRDEASASACACEAARQTVKCCISTQGAGPDVASQRGSRCRIANWRAAPSPLPCFPRRSQRPIARMPATRRASTAC